MSLVFKDHRFILQTFHRVVQLVVLEKHTLSDEATQKLRTLYIGAYVGRQTRRTARLKLEIHSQSTSAQ
jgi:hypothetical protein